MPRWTRWLAVASTIFFVPYTFVPGSSLSLLFNVLFFAFLVSLVAVQAYRYRWVSTPEQRQQTKWVVFGFAVALAGFSAVLITLNIFFPTLLNAGPLSIMIFSTIIYGFLLLVPISIGIAILRSGLWDIDVLINRTLVYGTLTVTLVLVYVVSIVLLQQLVRWLTGQPSELAIVGSTLAIAALFGRLRRHIQATIDRRFYRRKYDAAQTLAAFSARLRDEVELNTLTDDLVSVVQETLQPESVSLWLREPGRKT